MNKQHSVYLILLVLLTSCNSPKNDTPAASMEEEHFINQNLKRNQGKTFFDFETVDYYYNNIDENTASNLVTIQRSALDTLKFNLLIDDQNESINSNFSNDSLLKVGFIKKEIKSGDLENLRQIFSESSEREGLTSACIPIFRDILVFRKNQKISGVAKICFGCNDFKIIGSEANIENFGQEKDYEVLSLILDKYKKH